MATITIQPLDAEYKKWAENYLLESWGSLLMVSRGNLYNVLDFPGYVALVDGKPQGIITYNIENNECEVAIIDSVIEGSGLGSKLIEQVKEVARKKGCRRLWLVTTNDNIHAFRWYQKRGFTIAAVHVNALEMSRILKPEIPLLGNENIPLRDEIEFEIIL